MLVPDVVASGSISVAGLSPKCMGTIQWPRIRSLRLCQEILRTQCFRPDLQANQGDRKCHLTSRGAKNHSPSLRTDPARVLNPKLLFLLALRRLNQCHIHLFQVIQTVMYFKGLKTTIRSSSQKHTLQLIVSKPIFSFLPLFFFFPPEISSNRKDLKLQAKNKIESEATFDSSPFSKQQKHVEHS